MVCMLLLRRFRSGLKRSILIGWTNTLRKMIGFSLFSEHCNATLVKIGAIFYSFKDILLFRSPLVDVLNVIVHIYFMFIHLGQR